MNQSNNPDVRGIGTGLELDLKILTEAFLLLQLANLYKLLHHGDVCQMSTGIFPAQNLRLRMIEGYHYINIGVVFFGATIDLEGAPGI